MGADELTTIAASAAAVLGMIGGVLRYLVRMASAMERTSLQTANMGEAFQRHVTSSDALHAALTDRVAVHGQQLAVLNARIEGRRR